MFENARSGRLLAAVALVILVAGCNSDEPPPSPITNFGYLEIVPPSNLHRPGSINSVEFTNGGRVQLHPTCNIDHSEVWEELKGSETVDSNMSQWINTKHEVSGSMLGLFASVVKVTKIEKIYLEIKNPRILALTDESLMRIRRDILKGDCQEAVTWNIRHGANVCQAKAVIEADFVYNISYEEGVSAKLQSDITSQISTNLDLGTSEIGENYISGNKLFFAVKLDPYGIVLDTPDAKKSQCLIKT